MKVRLASRSRLAHRIDYRHHTEDETMSRIDAIIAELERLAKTGSNAHRQEARGLLEEWIDWPDRDGGTTDQAAALEVVWKTLAGSSRPDIRERAQKAIAAIKEIFDIS